MLVPALMVLLLSAVVAAVALLTQQWTLAQANRTLPGEGFYWSVVQYQLAHQRLKQELRAVAGGEPADGDAIAQRWTVLASRAAILTEPSAVNTLLGEVSGFARASRRISELHLHMAPVLDQVKAMTQRDAQQVLLDFKRADDEAVVNQLGNDARQAELNAKEQLLTDVNQRLVWVWLAFGLCWTVLALWLLNALQSRRRYAQIASDRAQALAAATQAIKTKRSFVRMVSHELRSPLQSIVTAAESLSHDTALGQSRPQSADAIRRIRHAVSSLQAQLRDLLTVARSDGGSSATGPRPGTDATGLQPETFDSSELVRDVCADFEEAALAKGLVFRLRLPDEPQTVHADPVRIAQVLRNLVENAVRYTGAGQIEVQLQGAQSPSAAHTAPRCASPSQTPVPVLQKTKSAA